MAKVENLKIKSFVIDRFAKFIIGGSQFESMKRIVAYWDSSQVTGRDKRALVIHEFTSLGYALGGAAISLGVELAVAWLRSKSDD